MRKNTNLNHSNSTYAYSIKADETFIHRMIASVMKLRDYVTSTELITLSFQPMKEQSR